MITLEYKSTIDGSKYKNQKKVYAAPLWRNTDVTVSYPKTFSQLRQEKNNKILEFTYKCV